MRVEQVVVVGNHLLPAGAVVVTEINEVQFGVGEVNPLGGNVQGQTIGPVDLGADDNLSVGAVHTNPLNPRVLPPVGPEEPPSSSTRVQGEASWLGYVLVDQDHPVGPVGFCHFYGVEP